MKGLRIISSGFFTTVQDLGRFKYQKFGMPQSGTMDAFSLQLANILVGNKRGEACLEVTFLGPEIAFEGATQIAITGADISPQINDKSIALNTSISVFSGDVLRFGALKSGCRTYVSFAEGLSVAQVLGSKSTYVKAQLGGYNGRALQKGDRIALVENKIKNAHLFSCLNIPPLLNKSVHQIHFIPGPEADYFSWKGIQTFLNTTFQVSPESDRMGYRLLGAHIEQSKTTELLSSGIANGTIQVPPNGKPIILLADRQTTGGYPRIGNVITADLPLLGQLKSGDSIKFIEMDVETAVKRLKEKEVLLQKISWEVFEHSQK